MADGRVVIEVELDDGNVVKGVANIGNQFDNINPKARKTNSGIKDIVTSLGLVKLASGAFNVMKNSMDGAINRFDTFNKFPTVMKALGYSTKQVDASMDYLGKSIDGLPTSLDEIVSSAQQLAVSTGDLDKGTKTAVALNDAFLASGASAADAARGADQYRQMLAKGEVDLQSWRTLQETMPIALDKTAKAFREKGVKSVNDLYDALKSGTITFDEFNDKLIELDQGVGGFAELARLNSQGIQTSFKNLSASVVKGLEKVLRKTDEITQKLTGKTIAQNIDSLKGVINKFFDSVVEGMDIIIPLIDKFGGTFDKLTPFIEPVLKVFDDLKSSIKELVTSGDLTKLPELFGDLGNSLGTAFLEAVNLAVKGFGTLVPKIYKVISEAIPQMMQSGYELTTGFLDGVLNGLPRLVESGKKMITNILNGLTTTMPKLWQKSADITMGLASYIIKKAPDLIKSGVELIVHLVKGILNAVPKLADASLKIVVQLVNYIIENAGEMLKAGAKIILYLIKGIISVIPDLLVAVGQITLSIIEAFLEINWLDLGLNIMKFLIEGIIEGALLLFEAIVGVVETTIETFEPLWEGIKEGALTLWDGVVEKASEVWTLLTETITNILEPYMPLLEAIWEGLKTNLSAIWEGIKIIAENIWNIIKNVILAPILLLIDLATGNMEDFKSHLTQIWENIKSSASAIWEGVKQVIVNIVEALVLYVVGKFEFFKAVIEDIWEGIKNISETIWNGIKETVTKYADLAVEGISKAWEQGKQWTEDAFDIIRETIESIKEVNLYDIGQNIVEGLANGLRSMIDSVMDVARNIAEGVKKTISSALSIHSPSRWMKNFIGKNMMIGWEQGLENNSRLPKKAMAKAVDDVKVPVYKAESVLGQLPSFTARGNQTTNNTTSKSYEPTINITVENAKLDNSRSIEDTSEQLAILTARQLRGRLELA